MKFIYTRRHRYTSHGYRPYTIQRVAVGAEQSGRLTAIVHEATHNTSSFEEFPDDTTRMARQVYACPNLFELLLRMGMATS